MANWIKLGENIVEAGKPVLDEAVGAAAKFVDEAYGPQFSRRLAATLQGKRTGATTLGEIRSELELTSVSRRFTSAGYRTGSYGAERFKAKLELAPEENLIPATDGIPAFNEKGFLPPGVYRTSYEAFSDRYTFNEHRLVMLKQAEPMLKELARGGIDRVYVGGSFVTRKEIPGDLDMLVHTKNPLTSTVDLTLTGLRGIRFGETQPPAKRLYGVDLMQGKAANGLNCEHLRFFCGNRDKESVGIIELQLKFK